MSSDGLMENIAKQSRGIHALLINESRKVLAQRGWRAKIGQIGGWLKEGLDES
jgi:hypothetical protein